MLNEAIKAISSLAIVSTTDERVSDAEWVSAFEFMGTCPFCDRTRAFQFDGDLLLYRCVVCGSSIGKNRINPERPFQVGEEETLNRHDEFSPARWLRGTALGRIDRETPSKASKEAARQETSMTWTRGA